MVDMITECLVGVFNGFMWKLIVKSLSTSDSMLVLLNIISDFAVTISLKYT